MLYCTTVGLHAKHWLFFQILPKLESSGQIFDHTEIRYFMKIRPVGSELFHTEGQTDMPKTIFTFRNTAIAPMNESNSNFKIYFDLCLYARKATPLLDKSIQIWILVLKIGKKMHPSSVRVIVVPLRVLSPLAFVFLFWFLLSAISFTSTSSLFPLSIPRTKSSPVIGW